MIWTCCKEGWEWLEW